MEYLFIVKKYITFFVEPLGLILFLGVLGWLFLMRHHYGKAKFFLALSLLALLLFSYPPFSNLLVKNLEDKYHKYDYSEKNIAFIHVLGSGNNDDASQPLSSQIGGDSIKRVIEGIMIHKRYSKSKLIFTGYAGHTTLANAKVNSDLAKALGVNARSMIINAKPKDTKEEALFSKSIIGKKPFILVTSATHMARAMKLFEDLGMHPVAAPTAFRKKETFLLMEPTVEAFENSRMAIHEYLGRLWAQLVS